MTIVLSSAYETLFNRMLAGVAAMPGRAGGPLTGFWPIRGRAYHGALMVIGRAVNGWIDGFDGFTPESVLSPVARQRLTRFFRSDSEPNDRCRMSWVSDFAGEKKGRYNSNRSAFWRVTRAILKGLEPGLALEPSFESAWWSHVCWSNVAKIAPMNGGNPSTRLWNAQYAHLGPLLEAEIREFNPRRILVMAGKNWFSDVSKYLGQALTPSAGLIEGRGTHEGRRWVLAKHPMGKPEARFVAEALEAFSSN